MLAVQASRTHAAHPTARFALLTLCLPNGEVWQGSDDYGVVLNGRFHLVSFRLSIYTLP